jgi:hypothetical protein
MVVVAGETGFGCGAQGVASASIPKGRGSAGLLIFLGTAVRLRQCDGTALAISSLGNLSNCPANQASSFASGGRFAARRRFF